MKKYSSYLGLLISIIYSLAIRYAAEFGYIDINSASYLVIVPIIVGFIPFFYNAESFIKNVFECILFPLFSTLLFLLIAVITHIEELLCFIIIGLPYIIVSIIVSLMIRIYKMNRMPQNINRNYLPPLLILPLLTGVIEKNTKETNIDYTTETSIIMNANNKEIWANLHAVPNLSGYTTTGYLNRMGIPKPVRSDYDSVKNVRLGYFDNGIVLNEKVIEEKYGQKLSFSIDFSRSVLKNSPTIENVIKEKSIQFEKISYELIPINNNRTEVRLSCKYTIKSNLQSYGSFLADAILSDFETNLLNSLKSKIENNTKQ
ncbi:hypothetical protein NAT51_06775 [Flavobacterium amniphilum]|uniref:hypothetical protein n=1 Tax=Flavobacterium amniphilum TaxID=1834035 RepID=UPI002029F180|nr:hypothetical protein [Flavobacterium amniphilum]MCL9805216.1 hypothetical protein [Flavobacterium amniphilum]